MSRGIQNRTEASSTGGTSESLTPLPQGWSYVPLGALCSMVAGGTPQSGTDSYWGGNDDPQNTPWISISDMSQVDLVANTEKYVTPLGLKSAGLNPGEIGTVLFAMYASVGEVAVSGISAVWNQALLGLIPLNTEILHSPFLYYALKTLKPHLPVYFRSNTQHNLNAGTVSRLRIPLPPLESQQRIADYLDRETAEIDAAVADLDRYVELLEKRRQVMIAQSVTRGIGSNRTRVHLRALPGGEGMMNSPTKKVPFWSLLEFINAPVESSSYGVRLEDIDSWTGRLFDNVICDRRDSQGTPFQPGDSLFGKLRPYLAKSWLATTSGVAVGDIHVYRPKRHCEPRFLSYILRTSDFIRFAEGVSEGVKMPRSEWSKLRQYPIPLPPLETQQRIADYLDRETTEIDSLISESTRLRDLLLKRRSVLITDVVTGRKQV